MRHLTRSFRLIAITALLVSGSLARPAGMASAAVPAPAPSLVPVEAATTRYINCSTLAGSGSYSNPRQIGWVSQTTIVYGCAPLSSGAGFNVRYFSFGLGFTPSSGSAVMTYFAPPTGGRSGVHPRLSWGATTVKGSRSAFFYNDGQVQGFYHSMAGLWAGGSWRVGAEKLSSPLSSLQTMPFNIIIIP